MSGKGLTLSFLRSFFLLIVVPILLILTLALGFARHTMLEEAFGRITMAQESVASALETEIRDAELALAQFLLVNQENALELASQYNVSAAKEKSAYGDQLTRLFNVMLSQRSSVVALHFYMKDGGYYGLKNDLALPVETIQAMEWYRSALMSKNHTVVNVSDEPVTYKTTKTDTGNNLLLTIAYAPEANDRYGQVEMVCLYLKPQATRQILQHTGAGMGTMVLTDARRGILFDGSKGGAALPDAVLGAKERFTYRDSGKTLDCFVTNIEGTPFRLISAVDQRELWGGINLAICIILGIAICIFSLFFAFSVHFFRGILKPVNQLILGMRLARKGDLSTRVSPAGRQEMQHLLGSFNRMMEQIQALTEVISEQEEEKRLQEVKALQAQINPHFLLNTLSSIHLIARIAKFESICDMTDALMQILRSAFKGDSSFHTVAEELRVLKSYILLMRIRYADRFDACFDVDESAMDCLIPRFTLQPIVENAIVHGINEKEEPGHLLISLRTREDALLLSVRDNGRGMDRAAIEQTLAGLSSQDENRYGIGISNVRRRIHLHYGPQYDIAFESEVGVYTVATITLPIRREGERK